MTEKDRKKDIKDVAKQILIVAKGINSLCINDEEQKDIALEIMKYSTTSEIDNLIEILAMTDITSSKYLSEKVECPTCKGNGAIYTAITDLTKKPPTETGFDLPCETCDGKGEIADKKLTFAKWKEETIESVNEIVVTDNTAFSEYLDSLLEIAFAKGRTKGAEEANEQLGKFIEDKT